MSSGNTVESSGVQELIDRLRVEGVTAGQGEAESLVAAAKLKAIQIRDEAKDEATATVAAARAEADRIVQDGEEALRLASRDVLIQVRESCRHEFETKLGKLVHHTLQDQSFLQRMILEIVNKTKPEDPDQAVQVLLPETEVTEEELKREIGEVRPDSLAAFVMGLGGDILRDGLTFGVNHDVSSGIEVRLVDDDVKLELSDESITKLLLGYLAPRFRAILDSEK